jgi:hypothetical protein
MRKALPLTLLLALCLAMPLVAGDEKSAGDEMMAPPAALDEATFGWMLGEWEGWTDSPMGKSEDWMLCEMGLGGQFLMMKYKSKTAMGDYEGVGMLTLKDGELKGYWVDTWRSMSEGTGTLEGTRSTITWSGPEGDHLRITELVGDKMVATIKMEMGGQPMEVRSEMTRVKHMGKGN